MRPRESRKHKAPFHGPPAGASPQLASASPAPPGAPPAAAALRRPAQAAGRRQLALRAGVERQAASAGAAWEGTVANARRAAEEDAPVGVVGHFVLLAF